MLIKEAADPNCRGSWEVWPREVHEKKRGIDRQSINHGTLGSMSVPLRKSQAIMGIES
jgi:hypothetical protein